MRPTNDEVMLNVIYFVKFNEVMKKRVLKKCLVSSLAKYGAHATRVHLWDFFFVNSKSLLTKSAHTTKEELGEKNV